MPAAREPEVIRDKAAMRAWSRRRRAEGKTVAVVPTMGYLHDGHLSLISTAAAADNPVAIVVTIYVNPSQFAPSEDLATYPSDFAGDLRKLASTGVVDAVFNPVDLYHRGTRRLAVASGGGAVSCLEEDGDGHETWVRVERLEKGLCGDSRPVFFRGVATIVSKLFNIIEPDVAVFGKKDYQQWRLICRMVRDLDFAIEIIGSEIVREADGLAMSSRNVHLSREEREKALSISRSLVDARTAALKGNTDCTQIKNKIVQTVTETGGEVDYVEIVEQESLAPVEKIDVPVVICVAAWFGKVRLIDNIEIDARS
uniref:Pantoate--beta-alanine ligase n=1 Tax=Leersia perrieri TaxID=77586 RepID=A0A0D9W1H2_9ORYZ